MGLDLKMFEGSVPSDLLCAICGRVLVQPEMSSCQHVFCSACLRTQSAVACPVCGTCLELTSHPAPAQTRMRLLDLRMRCDHKCGQVLPLGKLPEHVASECPNTPVTCQFVGNGCGMMVRRCQLAEHCDECEFRPVVCDACGHQTLFKDLYMHQNRVRCVEARIKNQLILAVRSTRKEVKRHQNHLDRQQIRLEQHCRRVEVEHHKRMTTAQRQRRKQQNYNLQEGNTNSHDSSVSSINGVNNDLALNGLINMSARFSHVPAVRFLSSRENGTHAISRHSLTSRERVTAANHRVTFSREISNSPRMSASRENSKHNMPSGQTKHHEHSAEVVDNVDKGGQQNNVRLSISREKSGHNEDGSHRQAELFLTSTHENDMPADELLLQGQALKRCRNCKRQFRWCLNKPNSCRWHAGPIIELFGGTCYSCGRLDFQNGCMMGFHEV